MNREQKKGKKRKDKEMKEGRQTDREREKRKLLFSEWNTEQFSVA